MCAFVFYRHLPGGAARPPMAVAKCLEETAFVRSVLNTQETAFLRSVLNKRRFPDC